jgi:hypothetical protein
MGEKSELVVLHDEPNESLDGGTVGPPIKSYSCRATLL